VQRAAQQSDVAQSYAVRLMQHLVVPIFVLNPRCEVVIWNRACERLTGVAAADIIGTKKHWRAFYKEKRFCLADLVALERAMGMNLRPADVAARYGGEEFAVLMPDSAHEAALQVGERLREAIGRLCLAHGAPAAGALVTLSIGVATQVPMDEMHSDLLVAKADQALYAAKHSGRDRVLSTEHALLTFADKDAAARHAKRKVRAR